MAIDKKNGGKSCSGGRFLRDPRSFDGVNEERAATWMSRMNRLKKSARIHDEETLLIVEENLVDKAESWWNVVGPKADTWEKFESLFKTQYLSDLEDSSVDKVAIRMEELFNFLGNKDQSLLVRTFLNAINSNIAYEVEKESKPATFAVAKERARQVEKSLLKYGVVVSNRQGTLKTGSLSNMQEQVADNYEITDSNPRFRPCQV
ncbi:uncharacterized protein ATC70_004008 [Mucor velutinosus]|uniref:Retrotransposon gag domain-containing protein n=1 Tax=Mucor velutinosus TaxID=708070 RepID=A0AAN7DRT0_9FUNG|nr:hypothetical protein ATC70_004008 [Mucor velutinosus]